MSINAQNIFLIKIPEKLTIKLTKTYYKPYLHYLIYLLTYNIIFSFSNSPDIQL
jgi:hypothetical protein